MRATGKTHKMERESGKVVDTTVTQRVAQHPIFRTAHCRPEFSCNHLHRLSAQPDCPSADVVPPRYGRPACVVTALKIVPREETPVDQDIIVNFEQEVIDCHLTGHLSDQIGGFECQSVVAVRHTGCTCKETYIHAVTASGKPCRFRLAHSQAILELRACVDNDIDHTIPPSALLAHMPAHSQPPNKAAYAGPDPLSKR